jgi:TetR/AcrR family transcriptional regulator, cholesterol catabolism regulator
MARRSQVENGAAAETGGRRSFIIDKAAVLIDEHGYHNTSMGDIAEGVGLAKPTLYHYFRSKDEILFEIHNAMIERILASHEKRLQIAAGRWGELLRGMIYDIVALMETHPGHLRIFFEHHRELPDADRTTIRIKRNRYRDHLRAVICGGVAAGAFRAVDPDLAVLTVLGAANWTYQWLHPGGMYTAAEVTDAFYSYIVDGLAPRA